MDERIIKICQFLNVEPNRFDLLSDCDKTAALKAWDADDMMGIHHVGYKLQGKSKFEAVCDAKDCKQTIKTPWIYHGSGSWQHDGSTAGGYMMTPNAAMALITKMAQKANITIERDMYNVFYKDTK